MSIGYEFDYSIRDDGETFLAEVLDGIDVAVMVVDRDLAVRGWNRAMTALTGLAGAALEGERLPLRFPGLDAAWFHELLGEARAFGRARRYPLATGRRVLAELGAGATERLGACAIARVGSGFVHEGSLCLSFRVDGEAHADASAGHQAADALLANVAHQLRTPLHSTIGFLELVLMETYGPLRDRQGEIVGKALAAAKRMAATVDTLVKLSGIDLAAITPYPQPVALADVVEQARQAVLELAAETAVMVETAVLPPDASAVIDIARTADALVELARNAVQASPAGGRVAIEADLAQGGATFRVADEGPGIAAEEQPHIFSRYYVGNDRRLHAGGVGLGLAYAQACIAMQGGRIDLRSAPGAGALFTIRIPQASSA